MPNSVICVPDFGEEGEVDVIEISVAVGESVNKEDSLIVLESEKATIEVPCPTDGVVEAISIAVGDKVSEGTPILTLVVDNVETLVAHQLEAPEKEPVQPIKESIVQSTSASEKTDQGGSSQIVALNRENKGGNTSQCKPEGKEEGISEGAADLDQPTKFHAGPAVRLLARELGVQLNLVQGSGPKARVLKQDLYDFVKKGLQALPSTSVGSNHSSGPVSLPKVDFSKFGPVEEVPRTKVQRVSAQALLRSWQNIPQVTQFDEANISELEEFRQQQKQSLQNKGAKLTIMAFLVKACASALKAFPDFNASLNDDGTMLVRKQYINIGVAVDTPRGLLVPVIKDVDKKGLLDVAMEIQDLAARAKERKLSPQDMQGGCFSVSSLGGVGGTSFTPIVNWPEVAILGVSKSQIMPRWDGEQFQPQLMLPLSLSYDHRVIDGVAAALFTRYIVNILTDIRQLIL